MNKDITERCLSVRSACGDAIDWVDDTRRSAPRLDRESASLTLRLRRARNRARTLARTAQRPFAVGFFGLSQAGKSYLISALAANGDGRLDIALEGDCLNFLVHINPPGGGKEATGLVTRFTRRQTSSPAGYPVRLVMFSEVDLVKVLDNTFFKDFDREQAPFDIDADELRGFLEKLQLRRLPKALPGLEADDVVELQDYFGNRFPSSTAELKVDFWPTAITLAPHLDGDDRASLFSILWGRVAELTDTFRLLRETLARIRFAPVVYSEIAALVTRGSDGEWTPSGSIIDVDILDRLGKDMDDTLRVLPGERATPAEVVSVPRSVLAALTAEIELVLADPPKADLLETVDLLDFPGYRRRLSIGSLDEVLRQLRDDQLDPRAQLVLRGKVAYLFERYTDDQEMNALVMCTPSNQQSDVNDLGPVLKSWIDTTQGEDPQTRALRRCGLLWAVSKFDQRLDVVSGQTEDTMRSGWEGMMKLTLLERFGAYEWVHEWTPGQRFDNLFLVRKPGKAGAVIVTRGERESGCQDDQKKRLASLRKTFCEQPLVRKHIRAPEVAWDAMLELNDGGITRLTEYLRLVADPEARLQRIEEQIEALASDLAEHRLGIYYRAQDAAIAADKQRIMTDILRSIRKKPKRIGDLIYELQPSRDQIRALYLRVDAEAEESANDEERGPLIPLPIPGILEDETPSAGGDMPDNASRFARDAVRSWVSQLRELADQERMRSYFGLPHEQFDDLVGELITGADRLGLEQAIAEAIKGTEQQANIRREQMAPRQADRVFSILAG